jgi:hypothetical protein
VRTGVRSVGIVLGGVTLNRRIVMFIRKEAMVKAIREAVYGKDNTEANLKAEIRKLKNELEDLKTQKVMEEREIKHLVKLKEEKLEVENQKKVLELESKYNDKTMTLQKEYHNKQLIDIELARKEMKEVYEKIMERLPNINTSLEIKRRG